VLSKENKKYDYVLFSNILHHVNDFTAIDLLHDIKPLLSDAATLMIIEPEKINDDFGFLSKLLYPFERGLFRRHEVGLINLVRNAGLKIVNCSTAFTAPDALPFLKIGRLTVIEASLSSK
jgi:hypothetical protein